MALASPKLTWCVVRLGEDMNWWVTEISDEIHWDLDGLSIIDPRQFAHVLELIDPLRDYGFQADILENAFFTFSIQEDLGKGKVKLRRINDSLLESDEPLFALPDLLDEEKGAYADFLDHVTKLRLKLLNDLIDFEKKLTVDELEEEIRERQNVDFMEGRAIHVFEELSSILEYIPEGYELDFDDDDEVASTKAFSEDEAIEEDFPDVDEDETIEEDETMKWDDEEEEDEKEYEADDMERPKTDEDEVMSLDDIPDEEEPSTGKGSRKK